MSAHGAGVEGPMRTTVTVEQEDQVIELSVLLPDWQATALEEVAHGRGLTAGQMLRDILGEFFQRYANPRPANHVRRLP